MAIKQTWFRVEGTMEGKRQGYLCYLRNKPYKLFLKPDVKRSTIRVMARTAKYTIDLSVVPEETNAAMLAAMRDGQFVYINESQVVRTSGSNYGLNVMAGWYA